VVSAYWSARQPAKAIPLAEDLLKRSQAVNGRSAQFTQICMYNLGVFYYETGRGADAVPLLEEVYREGQVVTSWDVTAGDLLIAYGQAGKSAEAVKLIDELLADESKVSKLDGSRLRSFLMSACRGLLELKQFAKAEPICLRNLALHEKHAANYQILPWRLARAQSFLGAVLCGQKKYAEAEPLLVAGFETLRKYEQDIPMIRPEVLPDAIQRLVDLYKATGETDKAERFRKELEAARAARTKAAKR
jgi:eukaryotic-like serine/threonine-protein kinase